MGIFNRKNAKKQLIAAQRSAEIDGDALNKAMLERCIPVAKKILKIIVERDLAIGETNVPRDEQGNMRRMAEADRPEAYKEAAKEIMQTMLDSNLLKMEWNFVFQLVRQPAEMLFNIVMTDMDASYNRGICKMFGIEVPAELSTKMIDDFLKKGLRVYEGDAKALG